MSSFTFELAGGGLTVMVEVTEQDGALRFDLEVPEGSGTIGDLNAFYLDIFDESLIDGLSIAGADVTGARFEEDSVSRIDNFTNVKGEVTKEYGQFDFGVQFGTQGIGKDDIQSTSFVLSHDSADLSIDQFLLQDAAVRLTSVGEADGSRDGSLKIGGVADPIATDPDDPIEPPVDEEEPIGETDPETPEDWDVIEFEPPIEEPGEEIGEEVGEGDAPMPPDDFVFVEPGDTAPEDDFIPLEYAAPGSDFGTLEPMEDAIGDFYAPVPPEDGDVPMF